MKALRLEAPGRMVLAEVPEPAVREDELRVRTGASTICTSDLNDLRSNPFGIPLPVIMGHEAAGTVAAVGKAVRGFRPGDRVTAHPVHPCGSCGACREGLGHLCENMGHFGINRAGTFAEFFIVRQDRVRKVPSAVDFALAALAEPVAVCLQALEQARLKAGERLLILGDGPFGILMARLALGRGLGKIVVGGHHDARLAFAKGATTVNTHSHADAEAALRDAGVGGFHAVILAVGNAEVCRRALPLLRPKGRLVLFSTFPCEVSLDLTCVHLKELEVVGACNDQDLFDKAVALLSDPACDLGDLVTHRFPLADYRDAFALAGGSQRSAMKVALMF